MKQRPKRFLDPQIVESLIERGGSTSWGEIREDLLKKQKVADKTIWEALKRMEMLEQIKKEGGKYHLIPALDISNEPFQIIKSHSYTHSLEIWADRICSQENTDERVHSLARYMFRAWGNITSLTLYVLEKYVEIQDRDKAEEYLDTAAKTYLAELIKRTAILLTPPKELILPVLENSPSPKRTRISKQEFNRAMRIITVTLAREIPEEIMMRDESSSSGLKKFSPEWESALGFCSEKDEDDQP